MARVKTRQTAPAAEVVENADAVGVASVAVRPLRPVGHLPRAAGEDGAAVDADASAGVSADGAEAADPVAQAPATEAPATDVAGVAVLEPEVPEAGVAVLEPEVPDAGVAAAVPEVVGRLFVLAGRASRGAGRLRLVRGDVITGASFEALPARVRAAFAAL